MKTTVMNIETGKRIKVRDLSLRKKVNEDKDVDLTETEGDEDDEDEIDVMPPKPLVENDGNTIQLV